MRYYLDTEFIEYPHTVDLISLALVRDGEDGSNLYVVNDAADLSKANEFVRARVLPNLALHNPVHMDLVRIAESVRKFVGDDKPEFWGYYADYDWVAFCWLFGRMVDLPRGWPMYCRDVKQELDRLGLTYDDARRLAGPSPETHNALDDARWLRELHVALTKEDAR